MVFGTCGTVSKQMGILRTVAMLKTIKHLQHSEHLHYSKHSQSLQHFQKLHITQHSLHYHNTFNSQITYSVVEWLRASFLQWPQ